MTQTEALKLALEALEVATTPLAKDRQEILRARVAIREALAQPETVSPGGGLVPAVPVAVYGYCPVCGGAGVMRERRPNGDDKCTNGHKYPSSKALAQPEQEPVAWMYTSQWKGDEKFITRYQSELMTYKADKVWPLYTTPPQPEPVIDKSAAVRIATSLGWEPKRTWVGLTDEEMHECWDSPLTPLGMKHARMIEAKLKEKNA